MLHSFSIFPADRFLLRIATMFFSVTLQMVLPFIEITGHFALTFAEMSLKGDFAFYISLFQIVLYYFKRSAIPS